MNLPRALRRETTANPRAAVCWLCPSWFYGLTKQRADRKLDHHALAAHGAPTLAARRGTAETGDDDE